MQDHVFVVHEFEVDRFDTSASCVTMGKLSIQFQEWRYTPTKYVQHLQSCTWGNFARQTAKLDTSQTQWNTILGDRACVCLVRHEYPSLLELKAWWTSIVVWILQLKFELKNTLINNISSYQYIVVKVEFINDDIIMHKLSETSTALCHCYLCEKNHQSNHIQFCLETSNLF